VVRNEKEEMPDCFRREVDLKRCNCSYPGSLRKGGWRECLHCHLAKKKCLPVFWPGKRSKL